MRTRITPNTDTFYAVYSVLFFQISALLNVPFSLLKEAAVRKCSSKQVFLKILQYSQGTVLEFLF